MQLYYNPVSPYSQKVLVALTERGLPAERKAVNLADAAARRSLDAVSPFGKVPVLIDDEGRSHVESTAIVEFLATLPARRDDAPVLVPDDPDEARRVRLLDRLGDLYVVDTSIFLAVQERRPEAQRNEGGVALRRRWLHAALDRFEAELDGRPWLSGDSHGLADLAPVAGLLIGTSAGVRLHDHPRVHAWFERAIARPAWQGVLAGLRAVGAR